MFGTRGLSAVLDKRAIDTAMYRLETSKKFLNTSLVTIETKDYKTSANRSYYAVFHAVRSLLALDKKDFKRHSGIINEFRKLYIKTRILDSKLSDILSELFDVRNSSDYDDFYVINKTEVLEQYNNAIYFVNEVEKYLLIKINGDV
jgi:uncharacterized protein (UPF0332 family)